MTPLGAFFESYYRLRPVNATFTGVHDHDHRLPDWSPGGLEAAADEMLAIRASLAAARDEPPHDIVAPALIEVEGRDRELAISFLDVQIAEHESRHFQRGNPSLAAGEAIFGAISLMTRPFADLSVRAAAAAARLDAVDSFLQGARRSIVAVPDEWRLKCLSECEGADRLLADGVAKWIAVESIPAAEATRLTAAAVSARAAFHRFRTWLERDVSAAPVAHCAAGPELFDLLLKRGHWHDGSRGDLAVAAADALDVALARLDERGRRAAPGGWPEVQQRLADSHPAPDDYLQAFHRTWDECRRLSDRLGLVTWPDYPIRYVPVPAHTRTAAPCLYYLHYRSPAPYDRLAIHDYVVPSSASMSAIKLNHVVHHGAIGHHVQNYYAYDGPSEIGRVAAVDCASRIGMFNGGTMAEGWACYATDLMDEHGFLTGDESLAQQHTRARLAARAVVDIGLHQRSMTAEEAVAVYRDRIGMPADAARAEVCKNTMFPATAVMYWLGTEGLHRLRAERARVEGASFSLRHFHDRVLAFGSIPVSLLPRVWP